MSEETPSQNSSQENLSQSADWRARLQALGKRAFELAEMERLGFWPTTPEAAERVRDAQNELKQLQETMAPLRQREREIEKEIAQVGDIEALLKEIRQRRIERVKAKREARKIRRAQETKERQERYQSWKQSTLPHLGRGVSSGLKYEDGNDEKLQALGLPVLRTAEELATALGIPTSKLAWLTYHRGATTIDHYRHFTIPKRSGGTRKISAPKSRLRAAQHWILENVLKAVPVHNSAAAFRPKINIAHNAARHAGAGVLVRIDLKDFFPSITFARVKKMFVSLGYNEGVSTLFALLCTEAPRVELSLDDKKYHIAVTDRFLPQGASTSPAITNILCRRLDARLEGASTKLEWQYSRYADDLIFSSPQKNADARSLERMVKSIIVDEKFEVNNEKTAIMRPHQRQSVTGLVVNQNADESTPTIRVSRRDLKNFRAFCHHYEKRGRAAMTEQIGKDALSYARGYLSFIHMISPERATKLLVDHPWLERQTNTG